MLTKVVKWERRSENLQRINDDVSKQETSNEQKFDKVRIFIMALLDKKKLRCKKH